MAAPLTLIGLYKLYLYYMSRLSFLFYLLFILLYIMYTRTIAFPLKIKPRKKIILKMVLPNLTYPILSYPIRFRKLCTFFYALPFKSNFCLISAYILFLITFVGSLSIKSRNIKVKGKIKILLHIKFPL